MELNIPLPLPGLLVMPPFSVSQLIRYAMPDIRVTDPAFRCFDTGAPA